MRFVGLEFPEFRDGISALLAICIHSLILKHTGLQQYIKSETCVLQNVSRQHENQMHWNSINWKVKNLG